MSIPLFDPDDPRLTAYALGEATADERQAIEQLLETSPEARAVVEQTRVVARLLEQDFARENAAYQQTHPQPVIPGNIVPFPTPRRRLPPMVTLAWKAAAVFVAVASAIWLVGRRTPTAPTVAVQPIGRTATASQTQEAAPPPPAPAEPSASNDGLLAAASAPEASSDAAKLDAPPSAPLPLAKATPDAAPMLAEATSKPEKADEFRAVSPDQGAPGGGAPMLADRAAQAPPATEAPLLAAARPAPAPAAAKAAPRKEGRPEAAIVRLRQPDGTFVGGMLLTADGRILTTTRAPAADKPVQMTVLLADGREFTAAPGSTNRPGLLRINAASLPSVRLAINAPEEGSSLLVASVDAGTGNATFVRGQARRANGRTYIDGAPEDADFVFNVSGELLAMEQTIPAQAKSSTRARSAVRREVSVPPLSVRPFTAEERAGLTRPPR